MRAIIVFATGLLMSACASSDDALLSVAASIATTTSQTNNEGAVENNTGYTCNDIYPPKNATASQDFAAFKAYSALTNAGIYCN